MRVVVVGLAVALIIALVFLFRAESPGHPVTAPPTLRPRDSLPLTQLGWVQMHDHFVQTVGPGSGHGQPFGPLLVLADATFAPHSRFPLHSHQEMEIVSVVVSGTLTHFEPGRALSIPSGSAQLMSAREGITHAEGNETDAPTRMLQIWLQPSEEGGAGRYEVVPLPVTPSRAPATVSTVTIQPGASWDLSGTAYLVCTGGEADIEGLQTPLRDGDGLQVSKAQTARLRARSATQVVVISFH
jgi:redox-sensitive bicupin YhaK (pirin superfamily)